jgi:hypothetical protein
MRATAALLPILLALTLPAAAHAASISGDYLEVRTADVYTGPCFANGEVNLAGKEAVLAWHVRNGEWDGVDLEGLDVVAVVRASATLGDPHAQPLPARALLLVDAEATEAQRGALVKMARSLGGDLLENASAAEPVAIESSFDERPGFATLLAGDVVEVRTRALQHCDLHCGNEEVYYPPLTAVENAVPAVTLLQTFRGSGLGTTWRSSGKRSAFIATFAR